MSRRPAVLLVTLLLTALLAAVPAGAQESGPEKLAEVTDEAEYRTALADLSADNSGPHTIVLSADIVIAGSTDPEYTGNQPLTIDGQGQFTLDGSGGAVDWPGPVTIEGSVLTGNEVTS
ncbi:MAG: hypothetical protein AAGK32_20450, partial [Actinomycetota bacterium]